MDRILSTFLTEMDGIETGGGDGRVAGNVAVIGVTHNPDLLDPSLLRPGRLEKVITLGAPDFDVRKEIASRQLETVDMEFAAAGYFDAKNKEDVAHRVAMGSAGLSAVEVIAICREASMECLRDLNCEITEKPVLTYDHFKRVLSKSK
jgi:SpoVK/Ycf46/Vps4 family AAA+-type ATPase